MAAKLSAARRAALDILGEQRRRSAHARDLLRSAECMERLSARDRSFVTRLVLGVVATQGTLDEAVSGHLRGSRKLEPKVRDALRLSAYEMLYLDCTPAVAVSQGVMLVRTVSPRAAGLANAVLRRVAEQDVPAMKAALVRVRMTAEDPRAQRISSADLALVGGVPTWMARETRTVLGVASACDWALELRQPAKPFLASNVRLCTDDEVLRQLKGCCYQPEPTGLVGSWRLSNAAHLYQTELLEDVRAMPVDLSAQLVARIAAPQPGQRALEVGQGRATKSILMLDAALRMGGEASLVGVDSEQFKCDVARQRIERAGWKGQCSCVCLDGTTLGEDDGLPDELAQPFDVVLVDAPCSGVGTIRRHPEIAWSLQKKAVAAGGALPSLQLSLLQAASARVVAGGTLVYATCSFMRSEDEDVVRKFLESDAGADFELAPLADAPGIARIDDEAARMVADWQTPDGFLRVRPGSVGADLHFCARFVRK